MAEIGDSGISGHEKGGSLSSKVETTRPLYRSVFHNSTVAAAKVVGHKQGKRFVSPTDRLMSPCSKKLNQYKQKVMLTKSKPTKLQFNTKEGSDKEPSSLSK
ncbi:Spo12p KNAG_0E00550 [Huiozyma naganishii CBS 8797]|uniref:Uncharacterized protein n=1 Tax=Huiozyma naganishii (strain ATCC MYA-139 / BCRC 22969 / CBS 8797 / KCTC 17520 / NBRC 10181 / NCYC 3082 / Yp74L-3) TaxID=1071383 RepID=J7RLC8_HUIN7|nr:hypothetical protein KNAG_0E00550 [Kazachstania naganishii CBS 8797]CCK70323.1 hypothetical protein KNAG_0E00550 [Kazachstania naganishii CBS 8797]